MREHLIPYLGRRASYRARVIRLGWRPRTANLLEPTVLLGAVVDAAGLPVCDHVWLPLGRRLAAQDPRPGDVLTFVASARPYRKGRVRRPDGSVSAGRLDYKLAVPSAVRKLPSPTRSA